MNLATFQQQLEPTGQAALEDATALQPRESNYLQCLEKLRKTYPAELARAAIETATLRVKSRAKFANGDRMYFTREALEQASGDVVAQYRTRRLAPYEVVADLCCGIGGDALALAANGKTVHAVDSDPLRLAMAEANAVTLGLAHRIVFHLADVLTISLPGLQAAFADPDRRAEGRRYLDPRDYTPPLSALCQRFPPDFPLGVKIAPGVPLASLQGLEAETEFISVDRELKECALWFGPLRTSTRRATALPSGLSLRADLVPELPPVVGVLEYLFDPDPAVVRAGLAGQLAEELGIAPIDYTVALLTGAKPIESPLLNVYRVEHVAKYNINQLRDYLRSHDVGRITVVKRGSMIDADDMLRKLKLKGKHHRFVVLTNVLGEQTTIVGERLGE